MAAAVRGGWTTPPYSVRIGNLIKGAQLADRAEAERFAIRCAKPLKAEAMKAAAKVFGTDLKPFKNKGLKARTYDEIIYAPPTATGGGFLLKIYLRPGEAWAIGEWGTYDHLVGVPRGISGRSRAGRRGATQNLSAFGEISLAAKRSNKANKRSTVYLKAPGYAHPVRGPIVVKGMPPRGAIKYAWKLMSAKREEVVRSEWDRYVANILRKSF